jgi:hypothetical protein
MTSVAADECVATLIALDPPEGYTVVVADEVAA